MSTDSTIKCKKCGSTEKYKDGRCASCAREYNREYRQANKESINKNKRKEYRANKKTYRKNQRKYYLANRDKLLAQQCEYRQKNKEAIQKVALTWRQDNRQKHIDRSVKWGRENPEKRGEYVRKWKKKNLKKVAAYSQRYRAIKRGNVSEPYDFKTICAHYDNRCVKCGEKKPLSIDHILPVSKGGPDIASNIQPLCGSCNSSKGTRHIDYRPDAGPKRWIQIKLFIEVNR